MSLRFLEVRNFRCIEHAQLLLDERCTVICGENASGKTSLLESIFLLGCGHSFRTHRLTTLIRASTHEFLINGQVDGPGGLLALGICGSREGRQAKLNGQAIKSFADLALALPVQAIDPDVHNLIEEGPGRRRRYLDWGTFHVEQQFLPAWKRYQRALKQRNALLRGQGGASSLEIWNRELVQSGSMLVSSRERYVAALQPFIQSFGQRLLGQDVQLSHQRGWRDSIDLEQALTEALPRDRARAVSTVGPHRADLVVTVDGVLAKDRVSRGQQKMLASTLILAQQAHRMSLGLPPACLLVDDPAAELDVDNLGKLLSAVATVTTQLVVTSLRADIVDSYLPAKLFHVKHGSVSEMA